MVVMWEWQAAPAAAAPPPPLPPPPSAAPQKRADGRVIATPYAKKLAKVTRHLPCSVQDSAYIKQLRKQPVFCAATLGVKKPMTVRCATQHRHVFLQGRQHVVKPAHVEARPWGNAVGQTTFESAVSKLVQERRATCTPVVCTHSGSDGTRTELQWNSRSCFAHMDHSGRHRRGTAMPGAGIALRSARRLLRGRPCGAAQDIPTATESVE